MIYSIGYQGIESPHALIQILKAHGITTLVDVRSKPSSRIKGFSKKQLDAIALENDIIYWWAGKSLGGFSEISEAAIRSLAEWQKDKAVCLMCMEADPERCHRGTEIGERLKRYGVVIEHL
jgi:uncharacterized protein (DUF488 family)